MVKVKEAINEIFNKEKKSKTKTIPLKYGMLAKYQ